MKYLLILLMVTAGLFITNKASAQLPSNHERWIGTWEEPSGKAIVYDFKFHEDGKVSIEKSTGYEFVTEKLHWSAQGNDIQLSGPAASIPELNNARLKAAGENYFVMNLGSEKTVSVRRSYIGLSWLHVLFLLILLLVMNEVCRRYKYAAYIVFFILPVVLIPVFLTSGFDTVFRWVKLYSAVAGGVFFTLFRFMRLDRYKWARFTVSAILIVNILEACTQDYSAGHLANYMNAIAGVLNAIAVSRWMGIKRDENPPHDMLWPGMTVFWIIAYDLWNITFVYLNFPNTAVFTAMAILAPTIAALFIKKGTWMQARAYTLAIYLIYLFSFRHFAEQNLNLQFVAPLPRNEYIILGLAGASLISNIAYLLLHFRWRFTGKAPAHVQVGQNLSVI